MHKDNTMEKSQLLSNEEARQVLGEQVPGFGVTLAMALDVSPHQLYTDIQAGKVSKLDALRALAELAIKLQANNIQAKP